MLLLKSTHEALMKLKDAQIAGLQDEVRFLRNMVQPSNSRAIVIQAEADGVLEGRQDQYEAEDPRKVEIDSEAARLLSGHY
jgi:hypothetical protein